MLQILKKNYYKNCYPLVIWQFAMENGTSSSTVHLWKSVVYHRKSSIKIINTYRYDMISSYHPYSSINYVHLYQSPHAYEITGGFCSHRFSPSHSDQGRIGLEIQRSGWKMDGTDGNLKPGNQKWMEKIMESRLFGTQMSIIYKDSQIDKKLLGIYWSQFCRFTHWPSAM